MDTPKLSAEQIALLQSAARAQSRGVAVGSTTLLPGAELMQAGLLLLRDREAPDPACFRLTRAGWIAWHEMEIARLKREIAEPVSDPAA